MTPEELRAIRERCEAATPGEWLGTVNQGVVTGDGETIVFETGCGCCTESKLTKDDAAFIAAARTDVPALLAEVERLRGVHPSSLTDVLTALEDERDELLVRVANQDAELRATRESYNKAVRERDEAKALANAAVIANALCDKQRAEAEAAAEATRRIAREELAAATRERDEAHDEREQCRKLYEAECERTKTLDHEAIMLRLERNKLREMIYSLANLMNRAYVKDEDAVFAARLRDDVKEAMLEWAKMTNEGR